MYLERLVLVLILHYGLCCQPGCQLCSQTLCYACKDNMKPTVGATCADFKNIEGCLIYSNNTCSKCSLNYRLVNGSCVKDSTGCLRFISNECVQCGFGMTLNESKMCHGVLNCLNYSQNNNKYCLQCLTNFKTYDFMCVAQKGCLRFDDNGGCTQCSQDLILSGYSCVKGRRVIGCAIYDSNGRCLYCQEGLSRDEQYGCRVGGKAIASDFPSPPATNPCQVVLSQRCSSCIYGYYLRNFTCHQTSSRCDGYNLFSGQCFGCVTGYSLSRIGACVRRQREVDPNCNIDNGLKCISCRYRYYLDAGSCIQVSPLCLNHNIVTGKCLSCPPNYNLVDGACLFSSPNPVQDGCKVYSIGDKTRCARCKEQFQLTLEWKCVVAQRDPYCQVFDGMRCIKCSMGYYLNTVNAAFNCIQVNPLCATYHENNGSCLTCYAGYVIKGSDCVAESDRREVSRVSDISQKVQNNVVSTMVNSVATAVQSKVVNAAPVNSVSSGNSVVSSVAATINVLSPIPAITISVPTTPPDPNCAQFSNNFCKKCSFGFFKPPNAPCQQVSPQCKTFDQTNGSCLTCFSGYSLRSGSCIEDSKIDENCLQYSDDKCSKCVIRYYLSQSRCITISSTCQDYNVTNGYCLTCRRGFKISSADPRFCIDQNCVRYDKQQCQQCRPPHFLVNNTCNIIIVVPKVNKVDRFCISSQMGKCTKCSSGYWLNGSSCQLVNILCRDYEMLTGSCTSCYPGYVLSSGICEISSRKLNLCATSDSQKCTSCFQGYVLINGQCVTRQIDNNCLTYNEQSCKECKPGYYVGSGKCQMASVLCRTYDQQNGDCTSCHPGYTLLSGKCQIRN